MPHDGDVIKTPVCLPFKCVHEAVQINSKIIPTALFPIGVWTFDEERLHLQFCVGRGYHDSSLGLDVYLKLPC